MTSISWKASIGTKSQRNEVTYNKTKKTPTESSDFMRHKYPYQTIMINIHSYIYLFIYLFISSHAWESTCDIRVDTLALLVKLSNVVIYE